MMNSKAYQKYSPNLKYDTVTVTAYLEAKSGKDNKAVKTAKNSKQLTATASLGSSNYGGSGYSKVVTTDTEYPNFSFYNKSVVF